MNGRGMGMDTTMDNITTVVFIKSDNDNTMNVVGHDDECVHFDLHIGTNLWRGNPFPLGDFSDFR